VVRTLRAEGSIDAGHKAPGCASRRFVRAMNVRRAPLPSGHPNRPGQAPLARRCRAATAATQAQRPEAGPEATGRHPDGPHTEVEAPSWNEADSFRETTVQYFDDPKQREAVREFGRLLYNLATDTARDPGTESSNRSELRAVAADLRYINGYCTTIGLSAKLCSLDVADERLARFARKLARRVGALVESIEAQLS
jgi:hypothetical protein